MRYLAVLVLLTVFALNVSGQEPNSNVAKTDTKSSTQEEDARSEKEEFEKAIGQAKAVDKIKALLKFVEDFPESEQKTRALENIVGARAALADEKLRLSETEEGIALFKLAVKESPTPISDKLFSGLLVKFPDDLFYRGERQAAFEVATMIEEKVRDNPKYLLALATFYLSTENGFNAKRLAERVIEIDQTSAAAYYTLGFANRMNFDLEQAADAFAKSLEIDTDSINTKISLAEMKRALGLPEEAIVLYREVLEKEESNVKAKTGLTLSFFDAEKIDEAEGMMANALEQNPKNLQLLAGVAYWHAAKKNGEKAVELAQQAIAIEPRYTWTYIALARGFMAMGNPLAAERALLAARRYGNFPTLVYELACTRLAAGFNREAAEGLKKTFELENGLVKTRLGGRVERKANTFIDLLSFERKASVFQVRAADDPIDSLRLKNLLNLMQLIESEGAEEAEISEAADQFISGDDNMKTHRQLFVASQLLAKKKALQKVLEITKNAVLGVDSALDVVSPSSAVMAEQLYESRTISHRKGRTVIVPDIPHQTLSNIVRGRIEETAGWALFQQEKPDEAKIRLKRAISVLPKDSAWWRSSLWRLATILESEGSTREALDAYIRGYSANEKSTEKMFVIESLYTKINGSLDGLKEKLSVKPVEASPTSIFLKAQPKEVDKKATDEKVASRSDSEKLPETVPLGETKNSDNPLKLTADNLSENQVSDPAGDKTAEEKLVGLDSKSKKIDNETKNGENNVKPRPVDGLEIKEKKSPENTKTDKNSKKNSDQTLDIFDLDIPGEEAVRNRDRYVKDPASNGEKKGTGDEKNSKSGLVRPRIVPLKTANCEILVSQDIISLLNDGGSLGVLVGFKGYVGESPEVKAVSSSAEDIEVVLEPGIGVLSEQSFFLIKSVSTKTGMYNVQFETPCGKKKITVNVR